MFISFEGIDNCGKTTQIELLKSYLASLKLKVLCVREPGGTAVSEQIRNILLDNKSDIASLTELLLFETARAELINKIILPALNENIIVLSDRFIDSTTAYQGYGRGLDLSTIKQLNQIATQNLLPNITFYLKIDTATAQKRNQQAPDRMEQAGNDFMQRTMNGFETIAKMEPDRVTVIDASQSKEAVADDIIETLNQNSIFKNMLK